MTPEFREKCGKNAHHLFTPEARAKQKASLTTETRSAATRAAMARPDVQEKRAVFQKDPDYRARISRATSDALSSPEARERLSRCSRESSTPEVRASRSESIKKAYESPDVKERHRAAVKEAQNRPNVRAKHASRVVSDETRQKISQSSSGRKHSPEAVERMKASFVERRDRLLAESGISTWSEYISRKIRSSV